MLNKFFLMNYNLFLAWFAERNLVPAGVVCLLHSMSCTHLTSKSVTELFCLIVDAFTSYKFEATSATDLSRSFGRLQGSYTCSVLIHKRIETPQGRLHQLIHKRIETPWDASREVTPART